MTLFLSRRVFMCVFLGPRQSSTSAVSWVTECPVWLSSGPTMTEKHMAAGCIRIPPHRICLWHWHSISAGVSCVQTLRANVTACNRSSSEYTLNTCQHASLLFLFSNFNQSVTAGDTIEAHAAQHEPPAPQLTDSSAANLLLLFKQREQSPSYHYINITTQRSTAESKILDETTSVPQLYFLSFNVLYVLILTLINVFQQPLNLIWIQHIICQDIRHIHCWQ